MDTFCRAFHPSDSARVPLSAASRKLVNSRFSGSSFLTYTWWVSRSMGMVDMFDVSTWSMREVENCLALYRRSDSLFDMMQREVL